MKPTTFRNILGFTFLAAIVGYLIPNIYENLTATYIPVSLNTVIALLLLNLTLLYWILIFHCSLSFFSDLRLTRVS